MRRCLVWVVAVGWIAGRVAFAETLPAHDTIDPPPAEDAVVAERLAEFAFVPGGFDVSVTPAVHPRFDAEVRFPSAVETGEPGIDTVVMEWRRARRDGEALAAAAPAVLIVHSVQPQLLVGRTVAASLADRGVHAFVLHLPGYGWRLPPGVARTPVRTIERGRQAVVDVRRARDAIAALVDAGRLGPRHTGDAPDADTQRVTLVGLSLGGYVAATAAAIEPGAWDAVWLVASGADVLTVLREGERDAARVARWLAAAGYRDDALAALLAPLEPLPLLHRLDPSRTHLVRPEFDRVVPPASYDALLNAAALPEANVHRWPANHYTLLFHLPRLIELVTTQPR